MAMASQHLQRGGAGRVARTTGPGREDLEPRPRLIALQRLGEARTGGIAGAHEKHGECAVGHGGASFGTAGRTGGGAELGSPPAAVAEQMIEGRAARPSPRRSGSSSPAAPAPAVRSARGWSDRPTGRSPAARARRRSRPRAPGRDSGASAAGRCRAAGDGRGRRGGRRSRISDFRNIGNRSHVARGRSQGSVILRRGGHAKGEGAWPSPLPRPDGRRASRVTRRLRPRGSRRISASPGPPACPRSGWCSWTSPSARGRGSPPARCAW